VGARASLFTVISRNEREIVMGEEDRHLVFRTRCDYWKLLTQVLSMSRRLYASITLGQTLLFASQADSSVDCGKFGKCRGRTRSADFWMRTFIIHLYTL
jgi:hypothetical protein